MSLDDFYHHAFYQGPWSGTPCPPRFTAKSERHQAGNVRAVHHILLSVLLLLILVNISPDEKPDKHKAVTARSIRRHKAGRFLLRKVVPVMMAVVVIVGGFFYGSKAATGGDNQVIVYNWGEYLDPEAITMFEKDTGSRSSMRNTRSTRSCIPRSSPAPLLMTWSALPTT